jgi:hypothetical protein
MSITINIKSQSRDVDVDIPTEWSEMSIDYWVGLSSVIRENQSNNKLKNDSLLENHEENERLDEILTEVAFFDELKLNKDIFCYVTGMSKEEVMNVDVDKVTEVVNVLGILTEEYKPLGTRSFEFEGEEYFFPSENLKKNTYGDFIESTQLEMTENSMKNGRYDVLPEQMAILCRREGENYDEDLIAEKSERFKKLKMDSVFEFAFFLTNQSNILLNLFNMYSEKNLKE